MISSTSRSAAAKLSTRTVARLSSSRTATIKQVKCRLLTTKTPQKPQTEPPASRPNPNQSSTSSNNPNEMANPPDVEVEVTPQMKMANYALATALVGFVGGVWYYSMTSVGSQEQNTDDPLAQLKLEAQEAMDRQQKDNTPDERAQQLLQEFNRGDHDPDKAEIDALDELDAEESRNKKKKAWWKLW